jgi:hypothetical protein
MSDRPDRPEQSIREAHPEWFEPDPQSNGQPPPEQDPPEQQQPHETDSDLEERLLGHELRMQRVRLRARDILTAERRGPLPPFDAGTLGEILARPPQPQNRVESLIPWEAAALITAQRKTGKTTLILNYARSLLTGQDFLGRFGVASSRRRDRDLEL